MTTSPEVCSRSSRNTLFPLLFRVFFAAGALAVGLAGVFEDHEGDQAGKDYADEDVGPC